MKGVSSPKVPFQDLKSLQKFTYQCSASSTASEIELVFLTAEARHWQLIRNGITTEQCVVILDEATLPAQRSAALKVTHYHLDKPIVATAMLTNRTLDAAKTSRCLQVCTWCMR